MLRRLAERLGLSTPAPADAQCLIGTHWRLVNPELGVDWSGSPPEVMRAAAAAGLDLNAVANALPTEISARKFYTGLNVRCPDIREFTDPDASAFAAAVERRHFRRLESLVRRHPQLVQPSTPFASLSLNWAAWNGLDELLRRLLACGADVNAPAAFGLTPLHCAAARNHPETTTLLLDAGADPAARNEFFWTAADLADANGTRHALRALSRRGISPSPDGRSVTTFRLMGVTFPENKPVG